MQEQNFAKTVHNLRKTAANILNNVQLTSKYAQDLLHLCEDPENAPHEPQCREVLSRLREIQAQLEQMDLSFPRHEPRNLRAKRTTHSMKYLAQWEKIVEEQMSENKEEEDGDPILLPKPMIKKRLKQFEKVQKKRVSSTLDDFLDGGSRNDVLRMSIDEEEEFSNKVEEVVDTKPRIVDIIYKIQVPTEETV